MLVAHDVNTVHHVERLCLFHNFTKQVNFHEIQLIPAQTTIAITISFAKFILFGIKSMKIEFFPNKIHKFVGALTNLNVVQNATLKEKNNQHGGTNDIRLVSAGICLKPLWRCHCS